MLQELFNGLRHVRKIWKEDILGTLVDPRAVDKTTVDELELLAPAASQIDGLKVQGLMTSKRIFTSIKDREVRDLLVKRLCAVQCLIPSLRVYFENQKVLESCTQPLQKLLGGRPCLAEGSLRRSFYALYRPPQQRLIEFGNGRGAVYRPRTLESDRWVAWASLWAFCLRNFPWLSEFSPRKEKGKKKPDYTHFDPSVEKRLYAFAIEQGFDLPQQGTALPSCSWGGAITETPPILTMSGRLKGDRRCGRPFEDDFLFDREGLCIPNFFVSQAEADGDISPFFVKRDTFWTFLVDDETQYTSLGEELDPKNAQASVVPPSSQLPTLSLPREIQSTHVSKDGQAQQAEQESYDILQSRIRDAELRLREQGVDKQKIEEMLRNAQQELAESGKSISELRESYQRHQNQLNGKIAELESRDKEKDSELAEHKLKLRNAGQAAEGERKRKFDETTQEIVTLKRQKQELTDENASLTERNFALERKTHEATIANLSDKAQLTECLGEKNKLSNRVAQLDMELADERAKREAQTETSNRLEKNVNNLQQEILRLTTEHELLKNRADIAISQKEAQMNIERAKITIDAANWKSNQQQEAMNYTAQASQQVLQVSQQALQTSHEAVRTGQQAIHAVYQTASGVIEGLWNTQLDEQELRFNAVAEYVRNTIQQSGEPAVKFLESAHRSFVIGGQYTMWFILDTEQYTIPFISHDLDGRLVSMLNHSLQRAYARGQHIVFYTSERRRINCDLTDLVELWREIGTIFAGEQKVMDRWANQAASDQTALGIAVQLREGAYGHPQMASAAIEFEEHSFSQTRRDVDIEIEEA